MYIWFHHFKTEPDTWLTHRTMPEQLAQALLHGGAHPRLKAEKPATGEQAQQYYSVCSESPRCMIQRG